MEQELACLKIGWLAFLTTADKTAAFLIIYGFSGKVSFLQIDPFFAYNFFVIEVCTYF